MRQIIRRWSLSPLASVVCILASALGACSDDDPGLAAKDVTFGTSSLTSCGATPTTLMATSMSTKNGGGVVGDTWGFFQNGSVAETVSFPESGVVDFTIEARGAP